MSFAGRNGAAAPSIGELARQWEVVSAQLDTDLAEEPREAEEREYLLGHARLSMAEIERAVLTTEPRDLEDWVALVDLARKIIFGGLDYSEEQAERAKLMLEHLRGCLAKSGKFDLNRDAA